MTTASRRSVAWLLLTLSGLSLSVAWVLASPIGASPDEAAHINYAWGTVTGQTVSREHLVTIAQGRTATRVQVPQSLLQYPEPACYATHPERPVTPCLPIPADTKQEAIQASYMSRYPPLYYGIEGAELRVASAVGLSGPRVLYGARLASAVLSWLTVAFGVFLLAKRFPARVVLLATLLALPAMTWFLAGSVNPNGIEIAAAFLLAAGVLSMRVDLARGLRSVAAILAIPLGTLLLAWSRPLSWVWASLILALLLVPNSQRDDKSWRQRLPVRRLGATATTATVLVLVSSMAWFVYALQVRAAEQGTHLTTTAAWAGLPPVARPVVLLLHVGTMVSEQIGTFGWLDTPLPTVAVLAWVAITGVAVAAWSAGRSSLVPRWSVGAVLGLGYLAAILDEYRGAWGWQGRYLLPVTAAVCVFAIPGLMNGLERWAAPRRMVEWMLVVLMGVNALSVVWFLFRNVYGVRDWPGRLPTAPLPGGVPTWAPPLGQGAVLALVTLAFAGGVFAVWALRPVPLDLGVTGLTANKEGTTGDHETATLPVSPT
jgi:Predicted membrane protein (DUF2142)